MIRALSLLCRVLFAAAMNEVLCVGSSGRFIFFPSGVVIMPPASISISCAAAMSVTRSLFLKSTKPSVVPSAT